MNTEWKSCFRICISIFILFLCVNYWHGFINTLGLLIGAALPLIIGAVIAYPVNILMLFYEKHYFNKKTPRFAEKTRRPVCLTLAYLTMIAIIALVISLIVPQLISCFRLIFEMLPEAARVLSKFRLDIIPDSVTTFVEDFDWESKLSQIAKLITDGLGSFMDSIVKTVSTVFSGTVTALLSLIFSVYLLLCKDTLIKQFNRLLKRYVNTKITDKIYYVLSILNDCFKKYIVGQCTEAVILGVLCTIGMLILRIPYATMIGALVAFTALIPIAGAYIGAIIGALMILTISPFKALVFVIFLVILQQIEGNLIYPKVVGSSIGLPGIWVLAAITIGGGLMGILGMLLGVPVAAAVYRIIRNDLYKASPEDTEEQVETI